MKFSLVILVLVFSSQFVLSARNRNRLRFKYGGTHVNFQINIEVLDPKGLKVWIPHRDGLEIFSFHGNIVSPFMDSRDRDDDRDGFTFAHDVTGSVNGEWVYENNDIKLDVGDVLNYWVFLQYKGAGQRFNDLSYTVKNLTMNSSKPQLAESYPAIDEVRVSPTYTTIPIVYPRPPTPSGPVSLATPASGQKQCVCDEDSLKNVWTQMNATVAKIGELEATINPLEEKLNSLTETVVELIKNMDIGTKLLLTGNLPVRTNPVEDVRHLITDKLKLFDLSTTILQAEYKTNGIAFEVSSSVDKLRILKRSNDILSKLSYQIIDPDRPPIDVRMAK